MKRGMRTARRHRLKETVQLSGEVRAADLDKRSFTVLLPEGEKLSGVFQPEHEAIVVEALREHSARRLEITAVAEFSAKGGKPKRILEVRRLSVRPVDGNAEAAGRRPIWEVAVEIGSTVPDSDLAAVPHDLAKNLDHYLYGNAREEQ